MFEMCHMGSSEDNLLMIHIYRIIHGNDVGWFMITGSSIYFKNLILGSYHRNNNGDQLLSLELMRLTLIKSKIHFHFQQKSDCKA